MNLLCFPGLNPQKKNKADLLNMSDEVKNVHPLTCKACGMITPHAEDTVSDMESATVWHCLICGTERRPNEPGSPNEPVLA